MPRHTLKLELGNRILALQGVELRRSRFSEGEAFYVGGRELAHFHSGNELDLRLTRREIRARRAELEADRRITLRGSSDWLEVRFPRLADLDDVLALVEAAVAANAQ